MLAKLLSLDKNWSEKIFIERQPIWLRWVILILAHSADSWFWLAGLGILWYWGSERWKFLAILLIKSILILAISVMLIKLLVRRKRPIGEWGKLYRHTDPHSFPSGHAARAILIVVVLISHIPMYYSMLLVVWALLVSYARVALGVHYLSDVLAGLILGLVVSQVSLALFI